jgi:hypothetical protein
MRSRLRRIPNFVSETDNLILLLVGIGIGLALTVFVFPYALPRVAPFINTGVQCRSLAAPSGGYSRSMLAANDDNGQDLRLDVALYADEVVPGAPLEVSVIFRNEDRGPLILFVPEYELLDPGGSAANPNVVLEITDVSTRGTTYFSTPIQVVPNAGSFRDREIHLLEGQNRCAVDYEIAPSLPAGTYTIRAYYSNTNPGALSTEEGDKFDSAITNQGVWTGDTAESDLLDFTVTTQPTPAPAVQ